MTSVYPSVCLSVCIYCTLVDCDHVVEQKVEIGTCVSCMHAEADPDRNIVIRDSTEEYQLGMESVEFCTSAAMISQTLQAIITSIGYGTLKKLHSANRLQTCSATICHCGRLYDYRKCPKSRLEPAVIDTDATAEQATSFIAQMNCNL